MDELKLIKYIASIFPQSPDVDTGIGDDTAIIKINATNYLLTVDTMVENIHFKKEWLTPEEVGFRSAAINLSDIASMGGEPLYSLIAINMGKWKSEEIKEIFTGIKKSSEKYKYEVIGGNISSSSDLSITITMIGKAIRPVKRTGARDKDLIVVTGTIGDAALGMQFLMKNITPSEEEKIFVEKLKNPIPRIKEGKIISKYANSMIDISDGLLLDLSRILEQSGRGAVLEEKNIPRKKIFMEIIHRHNFETNRVLWGGEDYELLFTISEDSYNNLIKKWNFSTPLSVIGKITKEEGLYIQTEKGKKKIQPSGWIHK